MADIPTSPPQKKMENPQMTGKEREQSKERLRRIIQQVGVNPQDILRGETYAKQALKNPKMYPVALQAAIREGLLPPNTPISNIIDYKIISMAILAGKLTKELMQEGKI